MAAEPRLHGSGLIASTLAAGVVLGILDALDALAGGFASGLGQLDTAVVIVVSAAAVGVVGGAVGLAAGAGVCLTRALGVEWSSGAGLVAGQRVVLEPRVAAGLAVAAFFTAGAAIWALVAFVTSGTGAGTIAAAVVIATAALAITAGLGWLLSRPTCPPAVRAGFWLAGLAVLYVLESRLLYSFSRFSALAPVHGALLAVLVLASGAGLWLSSSRLRAALSRRRASVQVAVLVGCIAAVAAVSTHECFGAHRTRLFIHGRTSLAFRSLSLVPGCASSRSTRISRALRFGCTTAAPPASPHPIAESASKLRGVVLVLVDTMRGDRLEIGRAKQPLLPNLADLRERAAFFPNTYTSAPGTSPAIAALLAGSPIGTRDHGIGLPEALRRAGIRTVAVTGHANVTAAATAFDVVDEKASRERFDRGRNALTSKYTTARARARLAEIGPGRRFLLLVHYFDPHAHYVDNPLFDLGSGEQERYDAELRYTDHWIGVLLEDLRQLPDVGIVVTSDHGEELWEHRYKRHQIRLYDESTRVPLIVFDPRLKRASRQRQEVSIADVAPTVLDMLGVAPPPAMRGRSLWPAAAGAAISSRPVVMRSSNGDRWGVVENRRKLIFDRETAILEYYDLVTDPEEASNLADQPMAAMGSLPCALDRWMRRGLEGADR